MVAWLARDFIAGNASWLLVVRNGAIVLIFIFSGLLIPLHVLGKALRNARAHSLIQIFSFIIFPLAGVVVVQFLDLLSVQTAIKAGVLVMCCLPTTITSCVAFTRVAGGNDATALINAVLGNLLGVFLTPFLLILLLGRTSQIDLAEVVGKLVVLVVLPLAAGQVLRGLGARPSQPVSKRLSHASQICILLILCIVLGKSFASGLMIPPGTIALLVLVSLGLYLIIFWGAWWAATAVPGLRLDRGDRIAAAICGSNKTLAMGAPLIAIAFGSGPEAGLILAPILLYAPVQMTLTGLLAARFAQFTPAD